MRPVLLSAILSALLLSACSDAGPDSPSASPASSTAQGGIDPDQPVTVESYLCEDHEPIIVTYQNETAILALENGEKFELTLAVSASGARYVGDLYEWHTKGDEGTLSAGDDSTLCKARR